MRKTSNRRITPLVLVAVIAALACNDAGTAVAPDARLLINQSEGRGWFQRYVAIGTSVSMGWMSDGVVGASQQQSWPAQLARLAQREMSLPLISAPGCKAPFASPLITFRRTSNEAVNVSETDAICAPNEEGVELPAQNLAISGALTGDALSRTPELQTNPFGSRLYRRVLPLGETQVSALEKMNPKVVSVELGANDILGVHSGRVIAGVSYVPFAFWASQYNEVLDRVDAVTKTVVLVGLGQDIADLSSLRRGNELWEDRAAFLAAFNVAVNANCDGNQNLLVVPILVPTAVANGLGRRAAGFPPYDLSCAAGASNVEDRVLTPDEANVVNVQLGLMNAHIQAQAVARGYAHFELEVLYGLPKPPFSVVSLMTSATPYGPNISLDGLHPSAAGHTILANAALEAINARYALGITANVGQR